MPNVILTPVCSWCLVVCGEGNGFCAGADVGVVTDSIQQTGHMRES